MVVVLFSLDKMKLWRSHCGLELPYEAVKGGADTDLFSLVTMTGPERKAWSCVRGGSGVLRKEQALEQAPQGSDHGLKLMECKKRLDTALRHWVGILGALLWRQELDVVILVSSFQLGISDNSMIL